MPTAAYVAQTITTSGAALADLRSGGIKGLLSLLVTANPALADPTDQATIDLTAGAASSLTAGDYYLSYAFVGRGGGTLAGGRSAKFTVSTTPNNKPQVTLPALPTGAASINLYLTAVGGAAGSEVLYATGITATTANLSSATYADPLRTLPTENTTGLSRIAHVIAADVANPHPASPLFGLSTFVSAYSRGAPISAADLRTISTAYAALFASLSQIAAEVATLVYANPGTLGTTIIDPPGTVVPVRTF